MSQVGGRTLIFASAALNKKDDEYGASESRLLDIYNVMNALTPAMAVGQAVNGAPREAAGAKVSVSVAVKDALTFDSTTYEAAHQYNAAPHDIGAFSINSAGLADGADAPALGVAFTVFDTDMFAELPEVPRELGTPMQQVNRAEIVCGGRRSGAPITPR